MNITEFVMTGFKERDFAALSSSIDTPVMNDKYDGKSGKTQGDKNESVPALNATKRLTGSCIEHSFLDSFNIAPEAEFCYVDAAGLWVSLSMV
jgi:hypothetical protein